MSGTSGQLFTEIVFHQLWQSAVIAACAWFVLRSRWGGSAESRHCVWIAALWLSAALPLLALLPLPRPFVQTQEIGELARFTQTVAPPIANSVAPSQAATAISSPSASGFGVRQWLPLSLFVAWIAGFAWRVKALVRGSLTLRRWKREATPLALNASPPRLPGDVRVPCEIRESSLVSVPMVVGLLRPCILVPRDLHERVTPSQLSLALLHEIAHVQRRDNWLLLMQRLIEAVYFYNPFVHMLSRQVERERECSCDDRAIRTARGANIDYAECLVSMSRLLVRAPAPALAVGAICRPSQLRARVERLLAASGFENTRLSLGRVALAATALLLVAGLLSTAMPHASTVAAADSGAASQAAEGSARGNDPRASLAFVHELTEHGMSVETARERIAQGVDVNDALDGDGTPLVIAARRGDLALMQLLLEAGADPNKFSRGDGNPLIAAAGRGHVEIAKLLIERGADVNAFDTADESPLINAARNRHLPMVEYLIAQGADVNLVVPASTVRGIQMRSALSEARRRNHTQIVERLEQSGATR
jgi:bla regulator protein blaR1